MKTMDQQFADILRPRLDKINERVGEPVAQLFSERMKRNTEAGHGFSNDPYDSAYSDTHKKVRRKKGLQVGKVDLRMERRRIEQTRTESVGKDSTRIRFNEGGHIFKYHHTGTARGGKTRSIWPKTPQSIPDDIRASITQKVQGVLSGQK